MGLPNVAVRRDKNDKSGARAGDLLEYLERKDSQGSLKQRSPPDGHLCGSHSSAGIISVLRLIRRSVSDIRVLALRLCQPHAPGHLGRLELPALIVGVLDPSLQRCAQTHEHRSEILQLCEIRDLIRICPEIVKFLLRQRGSTKRRLDRSEPAFRVQGLQKIPDRVLLLLVLIRLEKRTVRCEVTDVAIAGAPSRRRPA